MLKAFSIADHLVTIDHSVISLNEVRCLHSKDKLSSCEACFTICPVGAIQIGKPPTLNSKQCQACLACLVVCPVGAYSGDDAVSGLLISAARLEIKNVELLCSRHKNPSAGISADVTGIRIRGCLAGLGSGAYMALSSIRVETITVRLDNCRLCPWRPLQGIIFEQINQANNLLSHWGKNEILRTITNLEEEHQRPYWDADDPPLSRRDLFLVAARQGIIEVARAVSDQSQDCDRKLGRDRLRINNAVDHLPEAEQQLETILKGGNYAVLDVSQECTACGTCVRVCPSNALDIEFDQQKTHYQLKFTPQYCIGCEACVHVCAPGAITVRTAHSFDDVYGFEEPEVVREGLLARCVRCKTYFTAQPEQRFCPICNFRKKNPFGFQIPPGASA